jgi:hypothetical protein
MRVLQAKSLTIRLQSPFPSISGGLVPGFDPTIPASQLVRVLFIENIWHPVSKDSAVGPYISEAELDVAHYDKILDNFDNSILKRGNSRQGKVTCLIASWVSQ